MRLFPLFSWFLILAALAPDQTQAVEAIFNTVRVEGRNYVNIADLARYYEFDRNWKQNGLNVELRSKLKWKKLAMKIDSRECMVNGLRVWLNDAPLESRSSILISEVDVRKTLDPLLRIWAVPKHKVKTIMIDPGHGGEDPGTHGMHNSIEKRLTLDLAFRVERLLKKEGFKTLMTRRTDTYVSLEDRSELANSSEADVFMSLHFNWITNTQSQGAETYCLTPAGFSSTGSFQQRLGIGRFGEEPGNEFDPQNMLLAYLVHQRLLAGALKIQDHGIKRARFHVIKATKRPSILVESGFLSNSSEEKRVLDPVYRNKLAAAMVEGLKKYAAVMNSAEKD